MKKIFVTILTIVVMLLFLWTQINVFNYFSLFGIIPNIGIILIISISMCAGKNIGAFLGIAYGVLYDSCFETSFGLYTLLFGLLGYLVGFLKGKLALDNKLSLYIIVTISTIFFEIINVLFIHYKNTIFDINNIYILKVMALEVIYNVFLQFLLYKPLMLLGDVINRSRRAYYEI